MATLEKLVDDGLIEKLEVELEPKELPWRCLYGTPEFVEWLREILPNFDTALIEGEISPIEQVDDIFHEYIIGAEFNSDRRFKKLNYTPDYFVWEFKTLDIRIFGWVPRKDSFVCTFGDSKNNIELMRSYGRYIAQTAYIRNHLDLEEPKCLESKEYADVISNQT